MWIGRGRDDRNRVRVVGLLSTLELEVRGLHWVHVCGGLLRISAPNRALHRRLARRAGADRRECRVRILGCRASVGVVRGSGGPDRFMLWGRPDHHHGLDAGGPVVSGGERLPILKVAHCTSCEGSGSGSLKESCV